MHDFSSNSIDLSLMCDCWAQNHKRAGFSDHEQPRSVKSPLIFFGRNWKRMSKSMLFFLLTTCTLLGDNAATTSRATIPSQNAGPIVIESDTFASDGCRRAPVRSVRPAYRIRRLVIATHGAGPNPKMDPPPFALADEVWEVTPVPGLGMASAKLALHYAADTPPAFQKVSSKHLGRKRPARRKSRRKAGCKTLPGHTVASIDK